MNNIIHIFYSQLDDLYIRGRQGEIENFLKEKIKDMSCLSCDYDPLVVAVYNELGSFCRGQGRLKEAIEWFKSALQLVTTHLGENSMEYATTMNNLAGAQRMDGQNEKAAISFEEALRIYQKLVGVDNYYYISCINNLSLLEIDCQNYDRAEELLGGVLSALEENKYLQQEKAITLCNLGTCALYRRNIDQAEQYLYQAEVIYRSYHKGQQVHLAAVCNSLGGIHYHRGNKTEAARAYAEAKELTEFYFGRSTDYAMACENLARCLEGQEAAELLQEGMAALERLGREDSQQYRRMEAALNTLGVSR